MEASPAVDDYLAKVESAEARSALDHLRDVIQKEVPDAQEVISYGIPSYKLDGYLVGFAAFKNHCSFFPGSILDEFKGELTSFKTSAGTIQFKPQAPLPDDIVQRIIRARVIQNRSKRSKS